MMTRFNAKSSIEKIKDKDNEENKKIKNWTNKHLIDVM